MKTKHSYARLPTAEKREWQWEEIERKWKNKKWQFLRGYIYGVTDYLHPLSEDWEDLWFLASIITIREFED